MRRCYLLVFYLLVLATVTLIVYYAGSSKVKAHGPAHGVPKSPEPEESETCQDCREKTIKKLMTLYSQSWKKQEANFHKFRRCLYCGHMMAPLEAAKGWIKCCGFVQGFTAWFAKSAAPHGSQLKSKCNGISSAVITQDNTPVGSKVIYDGEKRKPLQVTPKLFSTFVKEAPFGNQTLETCAVVGNSGILSNSSCGDEINSAQFVIRCNLPPLDNSYENDVGNKTNLVTANPSILLEKFNGLMEQRRPFAESLDRYGDSLLLLPAFSYGHNTAVSLRALYTLRDFDGSAQPIFLNPEYLRGLALFWRARGLRAMRISTGLIMASLASELCANVHLYGFWPFPVHPHSGGPLTNHYYDNRQSKKKVHNMPDEFVHLLHLHSQGIVRLHLGKCEPSAR